MTEGSVGYPPTARMVASDAIRSGLTGARGIGPPKEPIACGDLPAAGIASLGGDSVLESGLRERAGGRSHELRNHRSSYRKSRALLDNWSARLAV